MNLNSSADMGRTGILTSHASSENLGREQSWVLPPSEEQGSQAGVNMTSAALALQKGERGRKFRKIF